MPPLPLANLGLLVVKQAAKPFAKLIAAEAKQHRLFRDWICVPVAQKYNFLEKVVKVRAMRGDNVMKLGRVTKVPKLNEKRAVELGSELLSELIVLGISVSAALVVYNINASKEGEKEARLVEEKEREEMVKEDKLSAEREAIRRRIVGVEESIEIQNRKIILLIEETEQHKLVLQEMKNILQSDLKVSEVKPI